MSESAVRWRKVLSSATPVAVLGTLICCAIPITLVALGAGSVVASMVSTFPWLAPLSERKALIFGLSALLLAVNYWALFRAGGAVCEPGGVCHPSHRLGRWMRRAFWFSTVTYVIGFTATFLLLPIMKLLGY